MFKKVFLKRSIVFFLLWSDLNKLINYQLRGMLMKSYSLLFKGISLLLLSILVLPLVSAMVVYSSKNVFALQSIGIEGPFLTIENARDTFEFETSDFSVKDVNGYAVPTFNGLDGKISIPGQPMLPYKVHVVEVAGRVVNVQVGVKSFSYSVTQLSSKILPAPQPLFYNKTANQTLAYIEDEEIYSSNTYFPGRLVSYYVGYGSDGRTVIAVRLYPVQYNPVSQELVFFDQFEVLVDYEVERSYQSSSDSLLIITTSSLKEKASVLTSFYNNTVGITARVVTTNWIYAHYSCAENITEYSGFYNPIYRDYIYDQLVIRYNWTLALKIISYLRYQESNVTVVLLIGGADTVPPSFYYQFRYNSETWVPTDYFYASPDYDLIPNIYVGRIPFNDESAVEYIINKTVSWYNATSCQPEWRRKIAVAGGYPFGLTFMLGESSLSSATVKDYFRMFNITLLTRTNGNYNKTTIQNFLRNGQLGWLFVLCHGSGTSLADLRVWHGIQTFEELASASDLMEYPANHELPVVSSVACNNALWDDDLLYGVTTSFGEAVLKSPGAGIAYLGSARSAYELGVLFSFKEGFLETEVSGAASIHMRIIKAYNNFMGTKTSVSLGEVFAKGLEDYVVNVLPTLDAFYQSVALGNIFMLSLLGDPGLQLPVYSEEFTNERVDDVSPVDPDIMIDAVFITGDSYLNGTIPFYKALRNASLTVSGLGEKVEARIVRTYFKNFNLLGQESASDLEQTFIGNTTDIAVFTNKEISGLVLLNLKVKCVEAKFYLISAGLDVQPRTVTVGSIVNVEAFGINVIVSDDTSSLLTQGIIYVTIAGWTVSPVPVDIYGRAEWSFAVPSLIPGLYAISVVPETSKLGMEELLSFLSVNVTVTTEAAFEVIVSGGTQYEPEELVTIRIATLLSGQPTSANLTVSLMTPNQTLPLEPEEVATGEYVVTFNASTTPGTYFVIVEAEHYFTIPALYVKGWGMHAFRVTITFETIKKLIQEGQARLEELITNANGSIIAEIDTKYGAVQVVLEEIKKLITNSTNEIVAEISTKYGLIHVSLDALNWSIVQVADNLVEIRTMLGTIEGYIKNIENKTAFIETKVGEVQVSVYEIKDERLPATTYYTQAAFIITSILTAILIVDLTLLGRRSKPKK